MGICISLCNSQRMWNFMYTLLRHFDCQYRGNTFITFNHIKDIIRWNYRQYFLLYSALWQFNKMHTLLPNVSNLHQLRLVLHILWKIQIGKLHVIIRNWLEQVIAKVRILIMQSVALIGCIISDLESANQKIGNIVGVCWPPLLHQDLSMLLLSPLVMNVQQIVRKVV